MTAHALRARVAIVTGRTKAGRFDDDRLVNTARDRLAGIVGARVRVIAVLRRPRRAIVSGADVPDGAGIAVVARAADVAPPAAAVVAALPSRAIRVLAGRDARARLRLGRVGRRAAGGPARVVALGGRPPARPGPAGYLFEHRAVASAERVAVAAADIVDRTAGAGAREGAEAVRLERRRARQNTVHGLCELGRPLAPGDHRASGPEREERGACRALVRREGDDVLEPVRKGRSDDPVRRPHGDRAVVVTERECARRHRGRQDARGRTPHERGHGDHRPVRLDAHELVFASAEDRPEAALRREWSVAGRVVGASRAFREMRHVGDVPDDAPHSERSVRRQSCRRAGIRRDLNDVRQSGRGLDRVARIALRLVRVQERPAPGGHRAVAAEHRRVDLGDGDLRGVGDAGRDGPLKVAIEPVGLAGRAEADGAAREGAKGRDGAVRPHGEPPPLARARVVAGTCAQGPNLPEVGLRSGSGALEREWRPGPVEDDAARRRTARSSHAGRAGRACPGTVRAGAIRLAVAFAIRVDAREGHVGADTINCDSTRCAGEGAGRTLAFTAAVDRLLAVAQGQRVALAATHRGRIRHTRARVGQALPCGTHRDEERDPAINRSSRSGTRENHRCCLFATKPVVSNGPPSSNAAH